MADRLGFREREAAKALDLCAVFVVGPLQAPTTVLWPVRICVASDVSKRMSDFQTANWQPLEATGVRWFAGKPLAHRVAEVASSYLERNAAALSAGWLGIATPGDAEQAIIHAAHRLGFPSFDESERRRRLAAEVAMRIDRATAKLYGS